jgi:hypothetical protein
MVLTGSIAHSKCQALSVGDRLFFFLPVVHFQIGLVVQVQQPMLHLDSTWMSLAG